MVRTLASAETAPSTHLDERTASRKRAPLRTSEVGGGADRWGCFRSRPSRCSPPTHAAEAVPARPRRLPRHSARGRTPRHRPRIRSLDKIAQDLKVSEW